MRRLLFQLFSINFATFLITVLAVFAARSVVDPATTPLGRAQTAVALAVDIDQPPELLTARMLRMQREFGGRGTIYGLDGELRASNVDPPLALDPSSGDQRYPTYDGEGRQTGWMVFGPRPAELLSQTRRVLALAMLLAGIIGLGLAFWLTRRLLGPIEGLTVATQAIARGEFDVEVEIARDDEVGALGRAFNRMAQRLTLLQRSQRELLVSVSHELRTPLARMRVAHAMLQEGEPRDELLPELDHDLEELERMVARVLDAARMDLDLSRNIDTVLGSLEVLAAAELVERLAARFRLAHPDRELRVHADPELGGVAVDTAALLRACDNLLDNAVRYGPPDRPLELDARRVGERLELAVRDEGPGIPEPLHELVFTPFFRADPSRSRDTGGLGLGLTMVARIVAAHAGTIRLESRDGVGATFTISLPVVGVGVESQPRS